MNLTVDEHVTNKYKTYIEMVPTGWTVRGSIPGGGENFRTCPDRP